MATSMSLDRNEVVLITGANGYVATWLIHDLLANGYRHIRGTVRNKNDERSQHLHKLPITLFEADLEKPETFDAPLKGANVVFHIATPYYHSANDPQKEIVDPAVNGTLAVLRVAKKYSEITDVIITSSMLAIFHNAAAHNGRTYDESCWNEEATLQTPYPLSKTLAEKAAWKFMEDEKPSFRLLVVNPGFIQGPLPPNFKGRLGTSINMINNFIHNKDMQVPSADSYLIDVRDLATIHRRFYENKHAKGRLIAVSGKFSFGDMINEIQTAFPQLNSVAAKPPPTQNILNINSDKLHKDLPELSCTLQQSQ